MKLLFNSWLHNPKKLPARRINLNLKDANGTMHPTIQTGNYTIRLDIRDPDLLTSRFFMQSARPGLLGTRLGTF
jgi:hypothetical protein